MADLLDDILGGLNKTYEKLNNEDVIKLKEKNKKVLKAKEEAYKNELTAFRKNVTDKIKKFLDDHTKERVIFDPPVDKGHKFIIRDVGEEYELVAITLKHKHDTPDIDLQIKDGSILLYRPEKAPDNNYIALNMQQKLEASEKLKRPAKKKRRIQTVEYNDNAKVLGTVTRDRRTVDQALNDVLMKKKQKKLDQENKKTEK